MAKRTHTFTMKFKMENDVFFSEDGRFDPQWEIGRILQNVMSRVSKPISPPEIFSIMDGNGNKIGEAKIT